MLVVNREVVPPVRRREDARDILGLCGSPLVGEVRALCGRRTGCKSESDPEELKTGQLWSDAKRRTFFSAEKIGGSQRA